MKKLHILLIAVSALLLGIVIGRLSAPSLDAKFTAKTSVPEPSASALKSPRSFHVAGEGRPKSKPSVGHLPNSQPNVSSHAPDFAYDSSVPLRRMVGETVKMIRAESWINAGRATLADALRTQFWAIASGDVSTLAEGIILDDTAKDIIAKFMANAPASVRAEYASPEQFAALLLASGFRNLSGFTADRQRPISDSETIAMVSTLSEGQNRLHPHFAHFRKAPDGTWRRIIDDKMATSMVLKHALGE